MGGVSRHLKKMFAFVYLEANSVSQCHCIFHLSLWDLLIISEHSKDSVCIREMKVGNSDGTS